MSCKSCCKNFSFAVITLIFSGIAIALLAFLFIKFGDVLKINDFKGYKTGLIIAISVTCVLLVVGIILALISKTWTKVVNTIIVIIFAIIYLALGIVMIAFGKKVPEQVKKNWNNLGEPIEDIFHCCTYDNVTSARKENCSYKNGDCKQQVQKIFVDKATIIGAISIVISVIIIAIIVALCCCVIKDGNSTDEEEGTKSKDQFSTPLTYGW